MIVEVTVDGTPLELVITCDTPEILTVVPANGLSVTIQMFRDGINGESAYALAVENGFEGTEVEWLTSLKGEKGDKGDTGDQGVQGVQGEKGDTGDQGVQGEKGDKGDTGDQGIQGEKGDKGDAGQDATPTMSSAKIINRCPDEAFRNAHGNLVIGNQQYYGTRVGFINAELIRFPDPNDLTNFQKITMSSPGLGSLEYLVYNETLGKIYGCLNPNKLLVINDINNISDYDIVDITLTQGVINNGSVIMTDDNFIYIGTNQSPNSYFIKLDATDYSEVENVQWTGYPTVHSAAWNYDKSQLYFVQNGANCHVAIIDPTDLSFTTHFAGTSTTDDIAYIEFPNSDINFDAWLFLPGENRVLGSTASYLFNIYTQESFPLVSLPSTGCYWDSTNYILYSSCIDGFIETWTGDDLMRSVYKQKDPKICSHVYVNKEGLWLNEIQKIGSKFFCTLWNNELENGGDGLGSLVEIDLIKVKNTAVTRTEQVFKSEAYIKKEVTETLTSSTFLDIYFANADWDQLNGLKYGVTLTPNDSLTAISLDKHYIGTKSTNYFRINFNAPVTGTLKFTAVINP